MNKILIPFMLIHVCHVLGAQDLIVTNSDDSLNCKITKIDTSQFYYEYKSKGQILSSTINTERVAHYSLGHFDRLKSSNPFTLKSFEFGIDAGFSWRLNKIDENTGFRSFLRDLKSGYRFGIGFTGYSSDHFGWGLETSVFTSSASEGSLSGSQRILYVGPKVVTRHSGVNTSSFAISYSLGYMRLIDDTSFQELFGNTIGASLGVAFRPLLSDGLLAQIKLNVLGGSVGKFKNKRGDTLSLPDGTREGLLRIDLSAGIIF